MNYKLALTSMILACLSLVLTGCANNRAIDSYVDAVMLNEMNEDQQAIAKLQQSVNYNPQFALAYSLMGDIYQENNDLPKSAQAYERATQLNRWSYKDFFNLGKVNYAMDKFTTAVQAYVRATQIQPDSGEAHLGAAKSYYQLKDYDNAIKFGRRASRLEPNEPEVQQLLGDSYMVNKHYDDAIASYKRALEIDANQPQISSALALAYLRAGNSEAARDLLDSFVKTNPNSASYQQLGFAYLRLKQPEQAVQSYKKAVELDPNDWSARKGSGVALMIAYIQSKNQQLRAEALDQWRQSLALNPNQPRLQELMDKYGR